MDTDVKKERSKSYGLMFVALILSIIIYVWGHWNRGGREITTTKWTVVKVSTPDTEFEYEVFPISGIKPKYYVSVNGTLNPIEMPTSNGEKVFLGSKITTLCFRLAPNQGFDVARIKYKEK